MPREEYQRATQKIQSFGGKGVGTPMITSVRLYKDENGVEVKQTMYG